MTEIERLELTKDYLRECKDRELKDCKFVEIKPLILDTYKDNVAAFDLAIAALRREQERSKGCKNCTAGDGEYTVLCSKWGYENFCPKCGRPLAETE